MSTLQQIVSEAIVTHKIPIIDDVVYNIISSNIGVPYIEDTSKYILMDNNDDILQYFVDLMNNDPDTLLYTSLMNDDLRVAEYILLNRVLNSKYMYTIVYNLIYMDNTYLLNLYGRKYNIEYIRSLSTLWVEKGGNMDMIDILTSGGTLKTNYVYLYEYNIVKYGTIKLVLKYEEKRQWKSSIKSLLDSTNNIEIIEYLSKKL